MNKFDLPGERVAAAIFFGSRAAVEFGTYLVIGWSCKALWNINRAIKKEKNKKTFNESTARKVVYPVARVYLVESVHCYLWARSPPNSTKEVSPLCGN